LKEEAANKRPIGRPKKDFWSHNLDIRGTAVMHRGIGTQRGKLCGRGKKNERKA
jgi:hypothetical protein